MINMCDCDPCRSIRKAIEQVTSPLGELMRTGHRKATLTMTVDVELTLTPAGWSARPVTRPFPAIAARK